MGTLEFGSRRPDIGKYHRFVGYSQESQAILFGDDEYPMNRYGLKGINPGDGTSTLLNRKRSAPGQTMHLLSILNVIGTLILVLGISQWIPMGTAYFYGEGDWRVFLESSIAAVAIGGILIVISRNAKEISDRDGFLVVTFGWICAAVVGAAPYYISGAVPSITDAMFESMSGFTTTGSSIFTQYDDKSHGILLWRSMTQWFGGMGIIVLALVILPVLGIGGMQLYKREVPGPYSEKLTPRMRDTARALWSVYIGITVLEAIALYAAGMTPFDAINHALTTVSTGGFSTHGESIGWYQSPLIEWIVIFFMFVCGMNFSLHYRLLTHPRSKWPLFRDLEWRWYLAAGVSVSLMVVGFIIFKKGYSGEEALTKGAFQVVSILTTTGYGSDNFILWGAFPQIVLVLLMITGGCAGSTSGGVKWVRILLVYKYIYMELLRLVHPRVVIHAKINNVRVTPDILSNILAFIFLYLTTLIAVTILIALDGQSILTSFGAAVSAVGNIGPGLDAVGPVENYAHFSAYAKWVLIAAMLLGRLELMTVFVLFMPHIWKR